MRRSSFFTTFLVLASACLVSGCLHGRGEEQRLRWDTAASPLPTRGISLSTVAQHYERGCVCGVRLSNNCAHYLANAFIRAGYIELLDAPAIQARCTSGRPIRAQDMLRWFQHRAERFHSGIPPKGTGLWAGYQEKTNRRHVLIYDADTGRYYGTDHCKDWPVQWYYQW
jgi:hypothetical protein